MPNEHTHVLATDDWTETAKTHFSGRAANSSVLLVAAMRQGHQKSWLMLFSSAEQSNEKASLSSPCFTGFKSQLMGPAFISSSFSLQGWGVGSTIGQTEVLHHLCGLGSGICDWQPTPPPRPVLPPPPSPASPIHSYRSGRADL